MRQGITNSIKTMLSKVKQQKYSLSKPKKEDLNLPHPERRVKKADPFFIEESELEKIDIKNLILETDAPYLSPIPFRGKRNESSYTIYIAKKLAEIKNLRLEEVAQITTQNAKQLFSLEM